MNDFDVERQGGLDLSSALEAAAAEIRSSLERQVREIVQAAEEQASRIEREAAQRAEQIEREAHQRARESLQGGVGRAWAILGGIDDLEGRVTEVIGALRSEMEALINDLQPRVGVDPSGGPEAPGGFLQEGSQ